MENFDGSGSSILGAKKKRSSVSRRPHSDPQSFLLRPPAQPFGNGGNDGDHNFFYYDGLGTENKHKKLKLKVGGVTHAIHTQSTPEFQFSSGSSITEPSFRFDAPQTKQKLFLQANTYGNHFFPLKVEKVLQGGQWKNTLGTGSSFGKETPSREKISGKYISVNATFQSQPFRKSKRVPRRRVLDLGINDGDEYDGNEEKEIKYLGIHYSSSGSANFGEMYERNEKKLGIRNTSKSNQMDDGMYVDRMEYWESPESSKDDRKKTREEKIYKDDDYVEEKEPTSGDEPGSKRKKLRKGSFDFHTVGRMPLAPTTRNRALQSSKDDQSCASLTDFPNGLPPAPSKKQKDKLSEVEGQLKKAEAAQKRRIQSEKAAREAEAEAIRKILGQDSGRKKREEKMKKNRDGLAQGKAANCAVFTNTVRLVIGPTGTVVTFSEDIGLPTLFKQGPGSYPPPREKCAGPNCMNAYKYRDSKSKLPLCSLHCYRAIHERLHPFIAC